MWAKFSPVEISWLRKAAEFTDRTIYVLKERVRPGMPEYALAGIIEGAYRADGGLPHIAFLRSMPMGLQLGALTIVTDRGAESLHEVPFEPVVVEI